MNISKALIEKYHDGRCTPDEKKAVEAWLFDEDAPTEPIASLLPDEEKIQLREAMWQDIETVLPSRKPPRIVVFFRPVWRQAAAVLLIALLGGAAFYLGRQPADSGVIVVTNGSATTNKNLHEGAYSLAVGPNSNVSINPETGRIDLCGAMLINPNRDIELTIQGTCSRPDRLGAKRMLKKGLSYIALNYGSDGDPDEVVVLPEGSLAGLPPLLQRQLMRQFDI